tara:strand:- start:41763 stop:42125 length:363 start_codon:yes stop_codon:yes gene_type:complete
MIRVGDLERSIKFYTDVLGMKVLRQNDYPEGKFTLVFLGYGDIATTPVLELTYNYGVSEYDLGEGYGHIAIGVDDAAKACDDIRNLDGNVVREAGPMKHGTTIIAFVKDPDGYMIELIQE